MLNGAIKSQINKLRDDLWSGGVSNPMTGVEQLTNLLFIKRLDEIQTREEAMAQALKRPVARKIFPEGKDGLETPGFRDGGCPYELMRWSRFKNEKPERMYEIVADHLMPFLRTLGGAESVMASHMKGARLAFSSSKAALLDKLVQGLDAIPMQDRDTKGDVYEYLLSLIASAGENGQFRTPRHIIDLMVRMMAPKPTDTICDPAAGTAGFLMMSAEYLRTTYPELFQDERSRTHFETRAFTGYDFDETMLRLGAMNMMLHGIEEPRIFDRDSLAEIGADDAGHYSLILANPPFSGSLDTETVSKRLLRRTNTGKTELLFIAQFLELLTVGGRACVIVPNGVLEAEGRVPLSLRKSLVQENTVKAIISLPHWVFKPYASVATSIIVFVKGGSTEQVLYANVTNDGFRDDAKKTPIEGSQLECVLQGVKEWLASGTCPIDPMFRVIDRNRIESENFDLCPRFYLLEHSFNKSPELKTIDELFHIDTGNIAASDFCEDGDFQFATSAKDLKRSETWAFEGPAICIPTVSSTGHGHAAIKNIHYIEGRFSAATITCVLTPKSSETDVRFYYNLLLSMKDEVLVSLMRGTTNTTLKLDHLKKLKVPHLSKSSRESLMNSVYEAEVRLAELERDIDEARKNLEGHQRHLAVKLSEFG
jgi:type I restriction enzyme M protein